MTVNQYYVYKVTHPKTRQFYFGCRTMMYGDLQGDARYLGSGRWPAQMKQEGVTLSKTVIAVFDDKQAARRKEKDLIIKHRNYRLCMNLQNHSRISNRTAPRDKKIIADWKRGVSCRDVGKKHGVSGTRVNQIVRSKCPDYEIAWDRRIAIWCREYGWELPKAA